MNPLWRIPAYSSLGAAIAGAVFLAWLIHYHSPDEKIAQLNVWHPAKESPKVASNPKISTPIKTGKIKAYAPGAKEALKLPDEIKQDKAKQVVAATTLESDDHPQTVTTIVDTETGDTQTITRKEPLPWLAWSDRGAIGMYYGIKDGQQAVRLQARQELFRAKALTVSAMASVDQPVSGPVGADYFVGIGAEWRW